VPRKKLMGCFSFFFCDSSLYLESRAAPSSFFYCVNFVFGFSFFFLVAEARQLIHAFGPPHGACFLTQLLLAPLPERALQLTKLPPILIFFLSSTYAFFLFLLISLAYVFRL